MSEIIQHRTVFTGIAAAGRTAVDPNFFVNMTRSTSAYVTAKLVAHQGLTGATVRALLRFATSNSIDDLNLHESPTSGYARRLLPFVSTHDSETWSCFELVKAASPSADRVGQVATFYIQSFGGFGPANNPATNYPTTGDGLGIYILPYIDMVVAPDDPWRIELNLIYVLRD